MQSTYEDANLVLKLFELRREETLRKAREWFVGQFKAASAEEMVTKYPMGSQENTYARMVISYWDMACSFVTAGVLNQELFFESAGECLIVWEKIRKIVPGFRALMKNPKVWGNLETVGNAQIKFMESRGPEAYAGFQEMIQTIGPAVAGAAAKK